MHTVRPVEGDPSRYSYGRFFGVDVETVDMFDSLFMQLLLTLPIYRTYTVKTLERRPELIAYEVYGTVDLYAILMAYNGILDHQVIEAGTILNLFRKKDLDDIIKKVENALGTTGPNTSAITGVGTTSTIERSFTA